MVCQSDAYFSMILAYICCIQTLRMSIDCLFQRTNVASLNTPFGEFETFFVDFLVDVVFAGSKDLQQYVACDFYDWYCGNNEPWT